MRVTLLGTGDAPGTPKIGCTCSQCTIAQRTGRTRLRTSLLVESRGRHLLIDTSPDLRLQMLKSGSPRIDAVIWTHGHYDHFMGFGEFYRVQPMPKVFSISETLTYCGEIFGFLKFQRQAVAPYQPFPLFGMNVTLVKVSHPPTPACGVVLEYEGAKVGFTSDTNADLPPLTREHLTACDILILDALVPAQFHIAKHMNVPDATGLAKDMSARSYRLVHMSHHVPWDIPGGGTDGESFEYP